jgi:GT2 family glycosyltransferase
VANDKPEDKTTMPGKLSVIILTRDKVEMTAHCLTSLAAALDGLDHEVLLWDNASTENLAAVHDCAGLFQSFRYFRSEENLSFSIANNLCAREATGDLLLFLNNDVFLRPDTVRNLISPFIEANGVGATGGKLLYPDEKSVQSAGIVQMLWGYPSNYAVCATPDDSRIQTAEERFALTGAMLCVPQEIFVKVGGFGERYQWGIEDVDLCLKIRAAEKEVIYLPNAVAVHCESVTLKNQPPPPRETTAENNYVVYRRTWDPVLVPEEQRYIRSLKEQGIQTVAIFGMGTAARGLSKILDENGIDVAVFTASDICESGEFLRHPVVPLHRLGQTCFDHLMVASQFFFEVEPQIRNYDPSGELIWPVLSRVEFGFGGQFK